MIRERLHGRPDDSKWKSVMAEEERGHSAETVYRFAARRRSERTTYVLWFPVKTM